MESILGVKDVETVCRCAQRWCLEGGRLCAASVSKLVLCWLDDWHEDSVKGAKSA